MPTPLILPEHVRRRRRLPRVPRPPSPKADERRYRKAIIATINPAIELVDTIVTPTLDALVTKAESERVVVDTSIDDVSRLFGTVRLRFADIFTDARVDNTIERTQELIDDQNRRTFRRQVQTVLGIDPVQAEPWLADVLASHAAENASLIKTLPAEALPDIEEIVVRGLRAGSSAGTIRAEIRDRWAMTEGRAGVIARDQVSKLNSALNRARQTSLGVRRYEWLTSQDQRVRESHRQRSGRIFEWDKPIEPQLRAMGLKVDDIDGHPGVPIQCRCVPIPDLGDVARRSGVE